MATARAGRRRSTTSTPRSQDESKGAAPPAAGGSGRPSGRVEVVGDRGTYWLLPHPNALLLASVGGVWRGSALAIGMRRMR